MKFSLWMSVTILPQKYIEPRLTVNTRPHLISFPKGDFTEGRAELPREAPEAILCVRTEKSTVFCKSLALALLDRQVENAFVFQRHREARHYIRYLPFWNMQNGGAGPNAIEDFPKCHFLKAQNLTMSTDNPGR